MAKKKVVVFGSSGFVGRQLSFALIESGHQVFGVDKREASAENKETPWHTFIFDLVHDGDFSNFPLDVDCAVFLAAALPLSSRGGVEATNIAIGQTYAKFLKAGLSKSAILISSSSVYDAKPKKPYGREDLPQPKSGYGRSKLFVEQELERTVKSLDIPLTTIRPTPIVGEGRNGLFELMAELIKRGIPIPIPNRSSDLQVTDVTDLVDFMLAEVESPSGRVWGAGNPGALSFEGYARTIATSMAARPVLIRVPTSVFRALGKLAIRARLTKLTEWHLDAMTYTHKFDDSMLPQSLISARACPMSIVSSVT